MNYEDILARFTITKRHGDQCLAKCPAHKDDKASLQIGRGSDGRTLLKCMAKCDTASVLEAVGLTMGDIMGDAEKADNGWKRYLEGVMSKDGQRIRVADRYDYRYMDGSYAFTKIRTDPKSFRYGKIVNDRWEWAKTNRKQMKPALFTADIAKLKAAITDGTIVFITEGEKDVKTMAAHGYIAATMGGANDWDERYAEIFTGGNIVILGDNDDAGRAFADEIRRDIENVTGSVRTVYPSEKDKGDVTDFFEDGGSNEDFDLIVEHGSREPVDLTQFHIQTKGGGWKVNRNAIAEHIVKNEHIIIIGDIPYVYDKGAYRADKNGAIIMTKAKSMMFSDLRDPSHMAAVFKLISTDSRLIVSPERVNRQPKEWICFENGYWNPIEKRIEKHDPKYMTINMVPHRYIPKTYDRSELNDFLEYAMPDEQTREMVLEFCGMCMTCDTRQQKMLILDGQGGTGKSTIIGLTVNAVGDDNVSNVSLKQLADQRFAAFDLYQKLLNSCADIDTGSVQDVSVIKQLTGEDKLRGEAKCKDAISFRNYAKIMFSVNGVPIIQGERSDGFFRRVLIAKFDRKPATQDKDLSKRLSEHIDQFIEMSVKALERMYERGEIFESERSRTAVRQWRMDGDSVEAWIADKTYAIPSVKTERRALYDNYQQYCKDNERTEVSATNFYKALRNKQYDEAIVHGVRHFVGLSLTAAVKVPEAFKDLIGRRVTE